MDPERLRSLLPWRHPFVVIDGVAECVPHDHIVATRVVGGDDMLALAHEPATAVFPGVMILEGLSQSAAVLFQASYGALEGARLPLLGHLKASFPGSAATGDAIRFTVRAVKMTSTHGFFEGTASVGGKAIVKAELAFAVAAPTGAGGPAVPGHPTGNPAAGGPSGASGGGGAP